MITVVLITFLIILASILTISFKCLGGKKESFLLILILSSLASFFITSLGLSIWLAIDDNAWTIEQVHKGPYEIDSIKVSNKILITYGVNSGLDYDKSVITQSRTKKSYSEFWGKRKNAGEVWGYGSITIDTNTPYEKHIYLNKKDYEIWKAAKCDNKK